MKTMVSRILFFMALLLITLAFTSREPVNDGTQYEAVIMFRKDLEKSIVLDDAKTLTGLGKIYYKDNYIYLTKRYKGIHIIDNRDPSNPVNLAFINIPGCQDIAIKQNVMYADNATDLVAIDISNSPTSISEISRIAKAFPNPLPPDLDFIPKKYRAYNRPENTVIVEWRLKQ